VVVEHLRRVEQLLREPQRPPRVARQQDPLGDLGVRTEMNGDLGVRTEMYGDLGVRTVMDRDARRAAAD
jgi:hypothetical protein